MFARLMAGLVIGFIKPKPTLCFFKTTIGAAMKRTLATAFLILLPATPAWAACNIINGKTYGDCSSVTVNTGRTPAIVVTDYHSVSGIIEGATVRLASEGGFRATVRHPHTRIVFKLAD